MEKSKSDARKGTTSELSVLFSFRKMNFSFVSEPKGRERNVFQSLLNLRKIIPLHFNLPFPIRKQDYLVAGTKRKPVF